MTYRLRRILSLLAIAALVFSDCGKAAWANRINLLTVQIIRGTFFAVTTEIPTLPTDKEWHYAKGFLPLQRAWIRLLLATGQGSIATTFYSNTEIDDCSLMLEIGYEYVHVKDMETAVALWQQCPDIVYYFINQGLAAEGRGETETASEFYRTAIATQSQINDPTGAYFLLIGLEIDRKNWEGAIPLISEYQHNVQTRQIQAPVFTEAVKIYSDMWEFLSVGHYLRVEGNSCEDALFWYDLARQRNPESAYPYVYSGVCTKDLSEKIMSFEQAILAEPDNALGHYWLGLTYKSAGNCVNALSPLRVATQLDKNNANHWLALAECYDELGDRLNAIAAYKQALIHNPNLPGAHAALQRLEKE